MVWYKVLRLTENATMQQIKGAYNILIRKYHPDFAMAKSLEECDVLMDKLKEVEKAYKEAVEYMAKKCADVEECKMIQYDLIRLGVTYGLPQINDYEEEQLIRLYQENLPNVFDQSNSYNQYKEYLKQKYGKGPNYRKK